MVSCDRLGQINRFLLDVAPWFECMGVGSMLTAIYLGEYTDRALYPGFALTMCGMLLLFIHFALEAIRYKQMYIDLNRGYL